MEQQRSSRLSNRSGNRSRPSERSHHSPRSSRALGSVNKIFLITLVPAPEDEKKSQQLYKKDFSSLFVDEDHFLTQSLQTGVYGSDGHVYKHQSISVNPRYSVQSQHESTQHYQNNRSSAGHDKYISSQGYPIPNNGPTTNVTESAPGRIAYMDSVDGRPQNLPGQVMRTGVPQN